MRGLLRRFLDNTMKSFVLLDMTSHPEPITGAFDHVWSEAAIAVKSAVIAAL